MFWWKEEEKQGVTGAVWKIPYKVIWTSLLSEKSRESKVSTAFFFIIIMVHI